MSMPPRENSGALFRIPDDAKKSEKSPGYEGEFSIVCPHCQAAAGGWVKAWVKEGKTGKFFSLAFKMKSRPPGSQ